MPGGSLLVQGAREVYEEWLALEPNVENGEAHVLVPHSSIMPVYYIYTLPIPTMFSWRRGPTAIHLPDLASLFGDVFGRFGGHSYTSMMSILLSCLCQAWFSSLADLAAQLC